VIKVMIVDDHELVRIGLKNILRSTSNIKVIGEACTGEQANLLAQTLFPDIIIMDIIMPGIGGFEATKRILRSHPTIKVIALTGYLDDVSFKKVIPEEAMGILTKDCDPEELIRAIKAVYEGKRHIGTYFARNMLQRSWN
jgi:two-component system invasion response regulator UvrY